MRIIHELDEMTETARGWLAGGTVGFIPTTGHTHAGHLSLIHAAKRECEITVVSIFVDKQGIISSQHAPFFPQDLPKSFQLFDQEQVDVVFVPLPEQIYPPDFATYVTPEGPITQLLEGNVYQDHFRGFATVMLKLLQLVRPDIIYMGQKDVQQVALLRRIIHDLSVDVNLRVLPTVRENDGLAICSANTLLSPPERQAASALYRALLAGRTLIDQGERRASAIEQAMLAALHTSQLLTLEYAVVCNPDTFERLDPLPDPSSTSTPSLSLPGVLLTVAASLGKIRLTDNLLRSSSGVWIT